MNINEHDTQPYDWENEGVYQIEAVDPVEGGPDGVSNRQAVALTKRTRNLHARMTTAEGEIDTLQEQTPIQVEAALRSANTYTDGKDTVLRSDMAIADTAAINAAKSYADQVVAALVDNSPAALNTLQELARALGNDPNFATTVMQQIGERMKTTDVNAALVRKVDVPNAPWFALQLGSSALFNPGSSGTLKWQTWDASGVGIDNIVYHSGNLGPATQAANGLMPGVDKAKLDGIDPNLLVKWTGFETTAGGLSAVPYYDYPAVVGMNIGNVEISVMLNMPAWYGYVAQLKISDYLGRLSASIRGSNSNTWHELYGTHNLIPATTAANGLMSAADKTKLDNMTGGLLAGYRIRESGYIFRSYGPKVSTIPVGRPRSGHFTVYHNIGDIEYIPIATAHQTGIDGNSRGVWLASIIDYGVNYVTVATSDSSNGALQDVAFNLILMR